MEVRVLSDNGEVRVGRASFSPDRTKARSVAVYFDEPIKVPLPEPGSFKESRGEEFYLRDHGCAIMVWGQGTEFPNPAWHLHPEDAAAIIAGGGG